MTRLEAVPWISFPEADIALGVVLRHIDVVYGFQRPCKHYWLKEETQWPKNWIRTKKQ